MRRPRARPFSLCALGAPFTEAYNGPAPYIFGLFPWKFDRVCPLADRSRLLTEPFFSFISSRMWRVGSSQISCISVFFFFSFSVFERRPAPRPPMFPLNAGVYYSPRYALLRNVWDLLGRSQLPKLSRRSPQLCLLHLVDVLRTEGAVFLTPLFLLLSSLSSVFFFLDLSGSHWLFSF